MTFRPRRIYRGRYASLGILLWMIAYGDSNTGPGLPESFNNKLLFATGTRDTSQIMVMDPDGSHRIRLTSGPGFRHGPVASPYSFGRIHDTTNCFVVGPALFPTSGSPNPMLSGVPLARRTPTT